MILHRVTRHAVMLTTAALLVASREASGQAAVTIAAGSAANQTVAPGAHLVVPIVIDMSAASGGSISTLATTVAWNAAFLSLDSLVGAGFGTISANVAGAAAGTAAFSLTSATPTAATVTAAKLFFTAGTAPGGTHVSVSTTGAGNAIGQVNLGQLLARNTDVCVAQPGLWGDANGDATVDIIDALQIARAAVGLSVASAASITAFGDVNADGQVDIIDAQQIARFAVSLPAPVRVNTNVAVMPVVASVNAVATSNLLLGATATLLAAPRDANGFSLIGCSPVTWATSDATKVAVSASGAIRGIGIGTASVTATSGSQSTSVVVSVTGPDTLSALLHLRNSTAGGTAGTSSTEGMWMVGGLLADEWKASDTFLQRNAEDQRSPLDQDAVVQTNIKELYKAHSDARSVVPSLIAASAFPATIGRMYFVMGYSEMLLAEAFCNGVPLEDASTGLIVAGPARTNAQLLTLAAAHFDTALTYSAAGDPVSVSVNRISLLGKARALVGLGQFAAAATLASGVSTSFLDQSTLVNGESNRIWSYNNSTKRYAVGDSVDFAGQIINAMPFGSVADPRVPVTGSSTGTSPLGKGFDNSTNLVAQGIWTQTSATPLLSGIDARLTEAEARLNAGDITGMMSILNALRAAPQNLGGITTPPMAALASPGTTAQAISLFFREKAFWTFGRGQRLGDLRRMMRVYGLSEGQVFPTGTFFKGGTYGHAVNLPVTVDESGNVLPITACTDRNP